MQRGGGGEGYHNKKQQKPSQNISLHILHQCFLLISCGTTTIKIRQNSSLAIVKNDLHQLQHILQYMKIQPYSVYILDFYMNACSLHHCLISTDINNTDELFRNCANRPKLLPSLPTVQYCSYHKINNKFL